MTTHEDGAYSDFPQWVVAYLDDHFVEGPVAYGISFRISKKWAENDFYSQDYGEPIACERIPEPEDPAIKLIISGLFRQENSGDGVTRPLRNWLESLGHLFAKPAIEVDRTNRRDDKPPID